MATSFDVNTRLGSLLAFNVAGGGIILGGAPQIQTVHNLDGQDFTTSSFTAYSGPLLQVNTLDDFVTPAYTTSSRQTVYLTNIGNAVLTITSLTYSFEEEIGPRFYYQPGAALLGTGTITVQPGTTSTFEIAYRGTAQGVYNNYFILGSNSIGGYYRVLTHQVIGISTGIEIDPSGYSTSTNHYGQVQRVTYKIIPIYDTAPWPDWPIGFTATITGSNAWTIESTSTNRIYLQFNPYEVNNVNGNYVSTLTVRGLDALVSVVNTGTINIDHNANKNIGSWTSPASHYNSIVGISYDLMDNQRYLTIGVGMGGDGVPIYGSGGSVYANVASLGLGTESLILAYPFWSKVYKIPFSTGTNAQVYYSNDYVVKTTTASDYSSYFGEYLAPGSMFIVEDDGYGSLKIEINHLRDLSSDLDEGLTTTLRNLTRAFHYYSSVDLNGRYAPLPAEYSAPIDTNTATTYLFAGFNYNYRDKLADINTSIVELPI